MEISEIINSIKTTPAASISSTTNNLEEYGLGGYDCPICENRGYVWNRRNDGITVSRECQCMKIRRSMRTIKNSGLEDMLTRYSFGNYIADTKERANLKNNAQRFVDASQGWLYISGRPGSGKSHLCTAMCAELINRGCETLYILWRDESVSLKSSVVDKEIYEPRIRKLKTISVLYIDDFFKGKYTDADVNLAFEIINARYNNKALRTIISSELPIATMMEIDEALGSRIYERSRGFNLKAPEENWRLRR